MNNHIKRPLLCITNFERFYKSVLLQREKRRTSENFTKFAQKPVFFGSSFQVKDTWQACFTYYMFNVLRRTLSH